MWNITILIIAHDLVSAGLIISATCDQQNDFSGKNIPSYNIQIF